jgi:Tfp pilus assembly protein PilX
MTMNMKHKRKIEANQDGFASIVIALVLIIILSLLTIGFAQLARREQQSALDKQLASQAFYAAESGINDTVKSLAAVQAADASGRDKTKCLDSSIVDGNISPATGVAYSCVLVDLQPPSIVYSGVEPNTAHYTTFSTSGALNSLTVGWVSDDLHRTPGSISNGFMPAAAWNTANTPAVLEVKITPLGAGTVQRGALTASTFTVYMYPAAGSGTVAYNMASNAPIVGGKCTGVETYPCKVTITGLPGTPGGSFLVHVLVLYDKSDISINNAKDSAGQPLNFIDGQAQIDATGRAKNVLKRIQVRYPLRPEVTTPNEAIEAQSLCKRLYTAPVTPSNPPGTTFDTDASFNGSCVLTP